MASGAGKCRNVKKMSIGEGPFNYLVFAPVCLPSGQSLLQNR